MWAMPTHHGPPWYASTTIAIAIDIEIGEIEIDSDPDSDPDSDSDLDFAHLTKKCPNPNGGRCPGA
jgi:hypothetical protein